MYRMLILQKKSPTIPVTTENTEITSTRRFKGFFIDFENPLTDCGVAKKKKSENYLTYLF